MNEKLRKAAILITSLDKATAENLLAQLPRDEADRLRKMARSLGEIDPIEQSEVLEEFFRRSPGAGASDTDGVELAGSLAESIDAGAAVATLARPQAASRSADGFATLEATESEELARLLASEHPQTIAAILSQLTSERASEVLLNLSRELQLDVMRRLVDLDEANPEAIDAVKRSLESRLKIHIEVRKRCAAGLATVRQILHAAGPIASHELQRTLEMHDTRLATLVSGPRRATKLPEAPPAPEPDFEDLRGLARADLLKLIQAASPQYVRLAFAGASPGFAARLYQQLSSRQAKILRRAIENLGALPMSDIEEAQSELVRLAVQLDDEGLLKLPRPALARA